MATDKETLWESLETIEPLARDFRCISFEFEISIICVECRLRGFDFPFGPISPRRSSPCEKDQRETPTEKQDGEMDLQAVFISSRSNSSLEPSIARLEQVQSGNTRQFGFILCPLRTELCPLFLYTFHIRVELYFSRPGPDGIPVYWMRFARWAMACGSGEKARWMRDGRSSCSTKAVLWVFIL